MQTSTPPPSIKIPTGMSLVETDTGWEIVANREPMSKTVAFRLPTSTYGQMMALVQCFPDKGWGSAMRWLLDDDTVRAVIAKKIAASTKPRR